MSVRVRYAPSPTGLQHIGGVRTALFNYFFAKSNGGKFILRVEDTDRLRYSDESLQDLYDTFEWLGIKWDEGPDVGGEYGPYIQSERFSIYKEYAEKLVDSGDAYYCFCTSERLEQLRDIQSKEKSKVQGYDRHCRDLSPDEQRKLAKEFEEKGLKPVIRFKIPLEGKTVVKDMLFNKVKRDNIDISPDPVILKSDGFPTYHLANVIDDHFMNITHILRAQEWIPSGPLHILLYRAFGWEPPIYCHLPMVMGKDGQKLSKRHGATSVIDFRKEGYLPEAIINYVTLIGWSYDDHQEFFSKEDLEKLFSLEKINKAPGVFDYKKLDWFNGQYIRKLSDEEFKNRSLSFLQDAGVVSTPITEEESKVVDMIIPLVKERVKKLSDIVEMTRFIFKDVEVESKDSLIPKKLDEAKTKEILLILKEFISENYDKPVVELEELLMSKCEELGFKVGDMFMPLRVAVTCSRMSPPIFDSIKIIGKEKTLYRLEAAISLL